MVKEGSSVASLPICHDQGRESNLKHRGPLSPDLIPPPEHVFRRTVEDLLDKVATNDSSVTRREDQLDQLCNLLLLKLESDRQAKSNQTAPVFFRTMESPDRTAEATSGRYRSLVALYPDTFATEQDKTLRLSNETIASCVDALSGLRLIDPGVSTVAVAFKVLRGEALEQGEGRYCTLQLLSRRESALCRSSGRISSLDCLVTLPTKVGIQR